MQGGNFTVTGYNATTNYNVSSNSDAQTYILYPGVDMPNSFQVNATATNSNCSDYDIGNTTAVYQCAGANSLCCYDSNAAHYQVLRSPKLLALSACVPSAMGSRHMLLLLCPTYAAC